MKNQLVLFLIVLMLGCKQDNQTLPQNVESSEFSIPIPDHFSNAYVVSSDNTENLFGGYFLQNNSLDLIDLEKAEIVEQIKMQSSISDVVTQGGGVTLLEDGFIYKTHNRFFYFPENQNEPSRSYSLDDEILLNGKSYFNGAKGIISVLNDIPPISIFQGKMVLPLFYTTKPFHFAGIYLLDKDFEVSKVIPIDLGEKLREQMILFEGLHHPQISTDQDFVFISFPFSSKVIIIDPESGEMSIKSIPGKYVSDQIDPSNFTKGEYKARSIRYSAQFWDLVWDPYRKVFYRIEKEEHFDENGERVNTRRGDHWINIIDSNWKVLGHFKLPNDHFARPYITEEGIYFQRANSENESELRFAFYSSLPI